ncbi:MAG: hypothetical protein M1573_00280 [Candidatus Parvarchaeota archaeon]|nr:hypothetical protein [Candidatus Parvarchaeota archaeon]
MYAPDQKYELKSELISIISRIRYDRKKASSFMSGLGVNLPLESNVDNRKTHGKSIPNLLNLLVDELEDYTAKCDMASLNSEKKIEFILKPYLSDGVYEALECAFEDAAILYAKGVKGPYVINKYLICSDLEDINNSSVKLKKPADSLRLINSAYNRLSDLLQEYDFVSSLDMSVSSYRA